MARPRTVMPNFQTITFRFPKDVLERCRHGAEQEDRSLNEQVLHIMKKWLSDKEEKTRGATGSRQA